MANELDIVAGGIVLSMTASANTAGGAFHPPLTITETIEGKIKSKPRFNTLLDGSTIQHGQEYDAEVIVWDTGFDLLSEIRSRQDEAQDVYIFSPFTVHYFKNVHVMVSENKKFESSGKAHQLKLEFGTYVESNVTASIRNILRESGSMDTADPNNPQMPVGWESSSIAGTPSIVSNPSGSGNCLFWDGSVATYTSVRKKLPLKGLVQMSYGFDAISEDGSGILQGILRFYDNSGNIIYHDTKSFTVSSVGDLNRYDNTLDLYLPTQSADVYFAVRESGGINDWYLNNVQLEMGYPTNFVPR